MTLRLPARLGLRAGGACGGCVFSKLVIALNRSCATTMSGKGCALGAACVRDVCIAVLMNRFVFFVFAHTGNSKGFGFFFIAAAATYVLAEAVAPNLRAGLREIKQLWYQDGGNSSSSSSDQAALQDDDEARESRRVFLAHYAEAAAALRARLADAFFISVPTLATDEVYFHHS